MHVSPFVISSSSWATTIRVQNLTGLWHGKGDWPPSPFRLFQALVAGAYGGRWHREVDRNKLDSAFEWLESLEPPIIFAPPMRRLNALKYWVPNNDLDAKQNDPQKIGEIRTSKTLEPLGLDGDEPFIFAWPILHSCTQADDIIECSSRLHTFGLGADSAYARAAIVESDGLDELIASYRGSVARPSQSRDSGGATLLPCPTHGSIRSLHRRHAANTTRFSVISTGKRESVEMTRPPKALSRIVAYGRPEREILLEIRALASDGKSSASFYPIRLSHALPVAKAVRDLVAQRLVLADYSDALVSEIVFGRTAARDAGQRRLRFIPLPSIGTAHTDQSIRRVLVVCPVECPVRMDDLRWSLLGHALPGIGRIDTETGEFSGAQLVEAGDDSMITIYRGRRDGSVRWQTITPAILPVNRPRGRVTGNARIEHERFVTGHVINALRHADVRAHVHHIRIQKEPFFGRGLRSDLFEYDRFDVNRSYHAKFTFSEPVYGPLVIGDARWLGLGVMRPLAPAFDDTADVFDVETDLDDEDGVVSDNADVVSAIE